MRISWKARSTAVCLPAALIVVSLSAQTAKPPHVNRAIDLLAQHQPIYYTGSHEGTEGSFAQGMKDAQTWADYISYDMEHAPFDIKGLAEYMKGLVKGGPTRSGHRTPAVIVNVPVNGTDEVAVRANAWMFQQVLATGVHGVLLCHADNPGAARAFVDAVRFPSHGGRRGVHGNSTAAQIWGISPDEYARRADVWPLNPDGELLLGLKLEDKYALEHAEASAKVPGIGFAEWGPSDMAFSLGVPYTSGPLPAPLQAARARVFAAAKQSGIFFLNAVTADDVVDMIKEGVMIGAADERAAEVGRRFTRRAMPW
jgi:4-hydroxy-2-oxoheptanedioate aldolase